MNKSRIEQAQQETQNLGENLPLDPQIEESTNSPNAELAEQMLLGMLMLDSEEWDRLDVQLEDKDFYNSRHRLIYKAAHQLYLKNRSIDPITVIEQLKLSDELEDAGGKEFISELSANAISGESINDYASLVFDRSLRRKFISLTKKMSADARGTRHTEVQKVLAEAEEQIFALADRSNPQSANLTLVGEKINEIIKEIDFFHNNPDILTGQSTGFSLLDDKTSGLQNSDFIVLAGRPSMGKTSFALNIAASVATDKDQAALIFSMEMPTNMLVKRLISILGSVNLARVRNGRLQERDWLNIRQAGEMLDKAHIYIDDSLNLTPGTIRSRIRRVRRMLPDGVELKLVVVDYIQLMHLVHTNENRVNEIAEISRSLKSAAKEFNLPVLALSQLNRGVEGRDNKRPAMSDLRDSGAIEQDADLILFIYRDEVYHPDKLESKGIAEIIIGKHRNGPTGMIKLSFQADYASFANLSQDDYNDIEVGQDISGDDLEAAS